MEWLFDPTAWLGLLTLVVLEIVLGIDNLVFIAILADKLPPHERDRARIIGLVLALLMRLVLLASISWLVTLTAPLLTLLGQPFSGRDLIMLGGGLFLLTKATLELHERLEGKAHEQEGPLLYARFWPVVAQIVVLDAVFSIDAVITAVGMADHLAVMMLAVIIAIGLMIVASKPLTTFVSAHPTVIMLCLGFLLMIGFSLVAEGFGMHIPKGYLYAAIGFSILIEIFNQVARFNRLRQWIGHQPLRQRTVLAVQRLLGEQAKTAPIGEDLAEQMKPDDAQPLFGPSERQMIQSVLHLAEHPLRAIMTPRHEVHRIDLSDSPENIATALQDSPYSRLVVVRNRDSDTPLGIVQKKDLLNQLVSGQPLNIEQALRQPLFLPETITVLGALEQFRHKAMQVAFVVDEFGIFEGLVTLTDVIQAIAGSLPEEHEAAALVVSLPEGGYLVDGATDFATLHSQTTFLHTPSGDYHTIAGLLLDTLERLPTVGESIENNGWQIEVTRLDGRRIDQVRLMPTAPTGK